MRSKKFFRRYFLDDRTPETAKECFLAVVFNLIFLLMMLYISNVIRNYHIIEPQSFRWDSAVIGFFIVCLRPFYKWYQNRSHPR